MADGELSLIVRIREVGAAVFGRVGTGLRGLVSQVFSLRSALIGAVAALTGGAFVRFVEAGERSAAGVARFSGVMRRLGFDAETVLGQMQALTAGTVSNSTIMRVVARATEDASLSMGQLATITEFATLRARAMGQTTEEVLVQAIEAVAKGAPRALAQFFPDMLRQMERYEKAGVGFSDRSKLMVVILERMQKASARLKEDLAGTTNSVDGFQTAIGNLLGQLRRTIATSPEIQALFQAATTWVNDLIKRLPEIAPAIARTMAGLGRIAGFIVDAFAFTVEGLTGVTAERLSKQVATILAETGQAILKGRLEPSEEGRRNMAKFFRSLLPDQQVLKELSLEQLQGLAQALQIVGPEALKTVTPGVRGAFTVQSLYPGLMEAIREAIILKQVADQAITGREPGKRPRKAPPEVVPELVVFSEAAEQAVASFKALQLQVQAGQLDFATIDELLGVLVPDMIRLRDSGKVTDEAFEKLSATIEAAKAALDELNPASEQTNVVLDRLTASAAETALALGTGPGGALAALKFLKEELAKGLPLDEAEANLKRFEALTRRVVEAIASAIGSLVTGLGNLFAELLGGGSAEFQQQMRQLRAEEKVTREAFEQGRLTAEQFNEQLNQIARERASLKEVEQPWRRFAVNMLNTLGDLALGVAAFATVMGIIGKGGIGFITKPFAVAAAAFAIGVFMKALASKIGGAVSTGGGTFGATGVTGSTAAGAVGGENRPIIIIRIVGQTSQETIAETVYDTARFTNLGGRAPGVGTGLTVVQVPGRVIVRGAG